MSGSAVDSKMIESVIRVYGEYGFKCERKHLAHGILVFTLNNGYFNNAEIVSLNDGDSISNVFDDYTAAGYACTSRSISCARDVELALFKGFFFLDSTKDRLKSDYSKFTKSITSLYSPDATYEYIDVPYVVNEQPGEGALTRQIIDRISSDKPALFLIEAAAGFGKTCTAYEVVNEALKSEDVLPLFSELSRNRSAKIFRYVLLDEIDRTFPQLKSRLVESEIRKGRVVVVLDGFDELLRKSESGEEFESAEPMLETIGELLQSRAKVILTTRRTVIFEGDDFHRWMDQNVDKFDVYRFRLSEPRVEDWLPAARRRMLVDAGFPLDGLANPVLLSYLRCISDSEFSSVVASGDGLVDKYFNYMLERERIRQDLRLDVEGQYKILTGIAGDMADLGYTSESRDYVLDLIKSNYVKTLDEIRSRYALTEKPSRDEVANKLASHALLDKSSSDEAKIGFVNEFVFGNFVAENILFSGEWLNDDLRFLEPAVMSYVPRLNEARGRLMNSLSSVFEYLDWNSRIDFSLKLKGGVDFPLISGEVDSVEFRGISLGEAGVSGFQFNDCIFNECFFERSGFSDVTFLNCKFYSCSFGEDGCGGGIHVLGCSGDDGFIRGLSFVESSVIENVHNEGREDAVARYILEKFWPVGTLSFHRRRPIKGICVKNNEFTPAELYEGIDALKRRGLLFEPSKPSFVEISVSRIGEIMQILGRGVE